MSETRTYTVTGMTCGHCVGVLTQELKDMPGVTDISVEGVTEAAPRCDGRQLFAADRRAGGDGGARRLTTEPAAPSAYALVSRQFDCTPDGWVGVYRVRCGRRSAVARVP